MSSSTKSSTLGQTSAPQTRYRKITACLRCRDRKKKCDRKEPICLNCQREDKECIYATDSQQLREHKQRLHHLNRSFANRLAGADRAQENPELNPLIVADAAYEDDADDDAADVGIRCGKLRISDRIGGMVRPKMVEELDFLLQTSKAAIPSLPQSESLQSGTQKYQSPQVLADILAPGPSYFAPASSTFWQADSSDSLLSILPDDSQAQFLLDQYWLRVHKVARVLHRPSFERAWNSFWSSRSIIKQVPVSFVALFAAIMFSSVVSLPDEMILQYMNEEKGACVERLKSVTESALSQANWIRTSKIETLQALAIFLIPLCRAEVSRAHSNLVAAAIRAAEGLGLHVDGTTRGYTPVQVHVRRLLWFQLSLLDIRTCEATGPRPQMRIGDFETKLPRNLDDIDIENDPEESYTWTEMTVTIIRMECNEFIRKIWFDRRLLQSKQITVTEVLLSIENFYQEMARKYDKISNPETPIQRYGTLLYKIQILRTFAMVLHQYHLHPRFEMSDRLKHVFIIKGIETMEAVMEFETKPDFKEWHWLSGAIQQHHYALALLMELLLHPQRKDSPRILRGLDYVFEPPNLPPLERVRAIVSDIRDRMWFYMEAKKLRAPTSLMEKLRLGRDASEPSDESSSIERQITPEDVQLMAPAQESELGYRQSSMTEPEQQVPVHTQMEKAPVPPAPSKHIMDLDWTVFQGVYPAIVNDQLDMSSEQFDLALLTGAYPPQISHYNQMPVHNISNQGYNYYSSLPSHNANTLPVVTPPSAQPPPPPPQQQSTHYYAAQPFVSPPQSTFQPINAYPRDQPSYSYSDSSPTFVQPIENIDFPSSSPSSSGNPDGGGHRDQHSAAQIMAFQSDGHHHGQVANDGSNVINTQSAAHGFPQQSDNEQNFGIGLYRSVPR